MTDRYTRYSSIISPEKLKAASATIVGVGAIGRQVAIQLATMGIGKLDLWDPDTVGPENFGTQGYRPDQLGKTKVSATTEDICQINPELQVLAHTSKFEISNSCEDIVAMCVDSIDTRRRFFTRRCKDVPFLVDGRMSAETARVLTSHFGSGSYGDTFFEASGAFGGSCTAKSTIYSAFLASALMVGEVAKFLRGTSRDTDITVDIVSTDFIVS